LRISAVHHAEDHVAVAFTGLAKGPEAVHGSPFEPDQAHHIFIDGVLEAHTAEGKGGGDGPEGLLGDGDANHEGHLEFPRPT
jgi:hypothetical protein